MSGLPPIIGPADILMDVQDNNLDNQLLGGDWSGGGGTGQVYAPQPVPARGFDPVPGAQPMRANFGGLPQPQSQPQPSAPQSPEFEPVPGAKPLSASFGQPAPAQSTAPAGVSRPSSDFDPVPGAQPIRASFGAPNPPPSGFDPLPGAKPISVAWGSPPQAQQSALSDFGNELWASIKGVGEDLVGAAGWAARQETAPDAAALAYLGQRVPALKSLADAYGLGRTYALGQVEAARQSLGSSISSTLDSLSPDAQRAMQASIGNYLTGKGPTPGQVGYWNYAGATLASALPDTTVVGLSLLTGNPELMAPLLAGYFGTTEAGAARNQFIDALNKAPVSQLMKVPAYKQAIASGLSDLAARKQVAAQGTLWLGLAHFGIGAATGYAGGNILARGPLAAAGKTVLARIGRGAAEGGLIGGAQGGASNVVTQLGNESIGAQKTFDPSQTASAVTAGTVGGTLLGAAFGALPHGTPAARPSKTPKFDLGNVPVAGPGDLDVDAALGNALSEPQVAPSAPEWETVEEGNIAAAPQPAAAPAEVNDAEAAALNNALPAPEQRPMLTFQPDRTRGEGIPWTSTGEGMIPGQGGFTTRSEPQTVPEKPEDIKAQVQALLDPDSTKDAVFVPKGTRMPALGRKLPTNIIKVMRPEGTLLTDNTAKAALYRRASQLSDTVMAHILGYPETRAQAAASGAPRVVQGRDRAGNVVTEMAASPEGEQLARNVAAAQAPGGRITTLSPEEAIGRRTDIHPIPLEGPVERAAMQTEEPTEAQAEAGNYQKGHVNLQGLDISIETPKGGLRRDPLDETGRPAWQTIMPGHYGYIRKTAGADGDHVDVTLGPRAEQIHDMPANAADHEPVFVVDQVDPATGKFDEHKAFVGYHTEAEAVRAYDESFSDGSGPSRRGAVTEMTLGGFKDWVRSGDTTNSLVYKPTRSTVLKQRVAAKRAPTEEAEAARQAEQAALRERIRSRIKKLPARVAGVLSSPKTNEPVRALIHEDHANNTSHSVHDYLDAIAASSRVPHMAALARRLKALLPRGLQVMSTQRAEGLYKLGVGSAQSLHGYWKPADEASPSLIALNPRRAGRGGVETVLHEAVHAVTFNYIRTLKPGDRDYEILKAIGDDLANHYYRNFEGELNDRQADALDYALSDPHELAAMLLTNPEVQRLAAGMAPSPELRVRMARLGYALPRARSLWRTFTGWLRNFLALGPESDTLLDHVLRPLTDIVERGARFNRDLPAELHPLADPVADSLHALPSFRDAKDTVADRIDPRGLGDKARAALLGWQTLDGVVRRYGRLFENRDPDAPGNALHQWRDATEAIGAASKAHRDRYSSRVSDLLDTLAKLDPDERDTLGQLANAATILGARLGPGADNSHLRLPTQQEALARLQAGYDALSRDAKRVYDGVHGINDELYATARRAQLDGLIKRFLPDATPAQRAEIAKAARSYRSLSKLVANPDASEVAQAFGAEWESNRALVRGIAKLFRLGFVPGDYFGLRRYGDYVLTYGDKGTPNYGTEFFERRSQADTRRDELRAQGVDVSQVQLRRTSKQRIALAALPEELDEAIRSRPELKGHADELRDLLANIVLEHSSRSVGARTMLRRKGILGASTDLGRVFAGDVLASSHRISWLTHGPDRDNALFAMRRHADRLGRNGAAGEQIAAQQVVHELERRFGPGNDEAGGITATVRKASRFSFGYWLMSASHWFTAAGEMHLNAMPLIGARHGFGKAELAILKAMRDLSPEMLRRGGRNILASVGRGLRDSDWDMAAYARDRLIAKGADPARMTDLADRLTGAGLIDHSQMRELYRIAHPTGNFRPDLMDRFTDWNAAGQHMLDVLSKMAVAKAAYDLEYARAGDHAQAADYATEVVRNAAPNYNLWNKPRGLTERGLFGPWARIVGQFRTYGVHELGLLANLAHESFSKTMTREERSEARKALVGVVLMHAIAAGIIANPLIDMGQGVADLIGLATGHVEDLETDIREALGAWLGPELGEIVGKGATHLAGMDVSQRIGLGNLLELPSLSEPDFAGVAKWAGEFLLGAPSQAVAGFADGLKRVISGDLGGLVEVAPRALRDVMKSVELAHEGVVDRRGNTLVPPSRISPVAVAGQALGFRPAVSEEAWSARQAIVDARRSMADERASILHEFMDGNRSAALSRVGEFNQRYPFAPITRSALLRELHQRRRIGPLGLRLPARQAPYLGRAAAPYNLS